jgi:hypothetical protein
MGLHDVHLPARQRNSLTMWKAQISVEKTSGRSLVAFYCRASMTIPARSGM